MANRDRKYVHITTGKGVNTQNIRTHVVQQLAKKQLVKKWTEDLKTFFQRHTDSQWADEKVLSISNHQGNANQTTLRNHLTLLNGSYRKRQQTASVARIWKEKETLLLVVI